MEKLDDDIILVGETVINTDEMPNLKKGIKTMDKNMKELVKNKDELERQIAELKAEIKERKEMIKKIDDKLIVLAFAD